MFITKEDEKTITIKLKKTDLVKFVKEYIEENYNTKVTKIDKPAFFSHICSHIEGNPDDYVGQMLNLMFDEMYTNAEVFLKIKEE
jgi:hypothetical protein